MQIDNYHHIQKGVDMTIEIDGITIRYNPTLT